MKLLLIAAYSDVEPLGVIHLAGLARDMGWERDIFLVRDFEDLDAATARVKASRPDLIGMSVYTGRHLEMMALARAIKAAYGVPMAAGGPHATYFPDQLEPFDYVVPGEGFEGLRKILTGTAGLGLVPFAGTTRFPAPDRETLFLACPNLGKSRVKSIITATGCPYRCTYCYNSSGGGKRLFPRNIRPLADVIEEGLGLRDDSTTEVVFFQDDVFGPDLRWLERFAQEWRNKVRLDYHAQARWENLFGDQGSRRLDLLKASGCFGLTLAIEAADYHVRKELLGRDTPDELIFSGMAKLKRRGFKVRTEQMLGLPLGRTKQPTAINLEADLALVRLNRELKPDVPWASIYTPYIGTILGDYCVATGFHRDLESATIPESFFRESVLYFLKEWTGPKGGGWMEEEELEEYRATLSFLSSYFHLVCFLPAGDKLAATLVNGEPADMGTAIRRHLYDEVLYRREVE